MNSFFDGGLNAFLQGGIDWVNDTIQAILVDADDIAIPVTDASNESPIAITAAAHGLANGDLVTISGVTGNTAANGLFRVTVVDGNTITLDGSTGNGAYVSGGQIIDLSNLQNLSDILAGARISIATLADKSADRGVADADDVTFTGVTGDTYEAIVLCKDIGVEATSTLIAWYDNVTGLPATPSGGNVDIEWSDGADRIFRL